MAMVYVQNKDGKPLMPTTRYCYVRLFLKEKKSRVVCTTPFTIQLNYDTPDITQDLILGIDPGRTNIGVAVVKEDGQCVFSAHLETRNKDVPLLMKKRAAFRRNHRTLDRRRKRVVRDFRTTAALVSLLWHPTNYPELPEGSQLVRTPDSVGQSARGTEELRSSRSEA